LCAGIALIPLILSAGQPGKEILYPVATVIFGGLISCTLLDFFVRPALFWRFGRKAAEKHATYNRDDQQLSHQFDLHGKQYFTHKRRQHKTAATP
ncbi:MAG TPA: efflux RND transporter permease subunit, partial [Thermoguttaceae bacterium]